MYTPKPADISPDAAFTPRGLADGGPLLIMAESVRQRGVGKTGREPFAFDVRELDTDGNGRPDGEEDANGNGRVDPGETDPAVADAGATQVVPLPQAALFAFALALACLGLRRIGARPAAPADALTAPSRAPR